MSYNLGNGLSGSYGYDAIGRLTGGWVCSGSTSPSCTGGTMRYGFTNGWSGVQLTGSSDSVLNQSSTYGYDEFNRLKSRTVNTGTVQNLAWTYDRFGNRWTQTVTSGSGPQPSYSFSATTNQITSTGFAYDAAGNMTNDGSHTYTYDAEGNITKVDSGTTATYTYDALNHRVKTLVGSTNTEFVFNASGQRVSTWNGATRTQLRGQYYWGSKPVAWYVPSSATHFQHQDWLGTERLRTTYNGAVEASLTSLPFGDSQTTESGGDPYYFASLDYDSESNTDHAQYRQYSSTQGRWMSPDPYSGSYRLTSPQTFNRYSYSLNNPLGVTDPSGLECVWDDGSYDSADDPETGSADQCTSLGGTWIPPDIFEGATGTSYGQWSSQASSSMVSNWLGASATAYGGLWAAGEELNEALFYFYYGGPQLIVYQNNDPFTLSFKDSLGMQGILEGITSNCGKTSGGGSVGTWEAFVNTMIDGPFLYGADGDTEMNYFSPEAQMGGFTFTYSLSGGIANITVHNPITLNSLAYHVPALLGVQNPTSPPFGTVNQQLNITAPDPCQ